MKPNVHSEGRAACGPPHSTVLLGRIFKRMTESLCSLQHLEHRLRVDDAIATKVSLDIFQRKEIAIADATFRAFH